ncbi:MAG TPA: PilZ domain-containing protein [Nitrospiria bacterium]|nr:PilZ domain-containing protein [Nitrospiria bacterium]
MFKESPKDKLRTFPRIAVELKGGFRVPNVERKEGWAEIQNLSHGGLMFIASSLLNRGDSIDMTFYHKEIEIALNAEVVWSEQLDGSTPEEFKYGLKFVRISDFDKAYMSWILAAGEETR